MSAKWRVITMVKQNELVVGTATTNRIRDLLPNNTPTFDRMDCRVRDLQVTTQTQGTRRVPVSLAVDGRQMKVTDRFFTSLFAKYGIGKSTFRWFEHQEVFDRISNKAENDKLVLTVEKSPDGEQALAVTAPKTVVVDHDELVTLLNRYGVTVDGADYGGQGHARAGNQPHLPPNLLSPGVSNRGLITSSAGDGGARDIKDVPQLSYSKGVVRSIHQPHNASRVEIAGDMFQNRFVMDTPIDGYGKPSIYLMLLREVCTNSAIGYAACFRSGLSLGKNEDSFEFPLVRAFEGYNNEDGFLALQQRWDMAAKSWASLGEINQAYKMLVKIHHRKHVRTVARKLQSAEIGTDGAALMEHSPLIKDFHKMSGDLVHKYGLANLDALGMKRQRTLPAGCKMYELLNFMSEVATHHVDPEGANLLQSVVGNFISAEYDLEGTAEKFSSWDAFLASDTKAQESLAVAKGK